MLFVVIARGPISIHKSFIEVKNSYNKRDDRRFEVGQDMIDPSIVFKILCECAKD